MDFPINASSCNPFTKVEPMITPAQVRERYLFGVQLTDEQGNELDDKVLQHYIETAVGYLEHKLDIVITSTEFLERYDYRSVDYTEFSFLQLKHRPIQEVKQLKAKFPNSQDLVTYPEEWFVVEKEGGQLQLSPVEGTFSGLIVTQGGSYVPLIYGARSYWPHLFEVKYEAGFPPDKIPKIINEMIGVQVAIDIFDILGDLILGPGVASESVSIDGASTTKNTTASAQYSGFSSRINSYRKKQKDYIKTIKDYYNGIPLTVV